MSTFIIRKWKASLRNQSEFLKCFQPTDKTIKTLPPFWNGIIIDGPFLIHTLPVKLVTTFGEYFEQVFNKYIQTQLTRCNIIHVVWDMYSPNSLKAQTHDRRYQDNDQGARQKVDDGKKIPRDFPGFLKNATNKTEFFAFLSTKISQHKYAETKQVYATFGKSVVAGLGTDVKEFLECFHEEADTRIVLHLLHTLKNNGPIMCVRASDSALKQFCVAITSLCFCKMINLIYGFIKGLEKLLHITRSKKSWT
eukprot:Lithocolla_globosa_v1_NODE_87_length_6640_cov_111.536826.p2 type:complete len:251 gc:universal NODE_87_length_6640_cov_111.536826:1981-1229(-)